MSNTNLTTKLTTLREQMEQAKADAMADYQTSQPFYNELGGLYGDGLEDCLKQVIAFYLDLDLSQVVINDTVSPTLGDVNTVLNEADGVIHLVEGEVKEPAQVETDGLSVRGGQIVTEGPFVPKDSSAPEGQFVPNALPA